jgi:sialate O-acetylesterase
MMKLRNIGKLAAVLTTLWLASISAQALNLPRIFNDNMVLQRDQPVKVWGWAEPGQKVELSFAGQTKSAEAGTSGKWMITLDPLKACADPAELTVQAGNSKVVIKNVLVGEVWICSGQSNMEWVINDTHNAKETIADAKYPLIRHFKVPHVTNTKPQKDLPGDWQVCAPDKVAWFTAVGYHFGLQLHKKLNVPIGLINTSWGGTRIEPWTDPDGFAISPKLSGITEQIAKANQEYRANLGKHLNAVENWVKQAREQLSASGDVPAFPALPEHSLNRADRPTAIYHAMVAPLVPFTIRGAIWYQGESNNGEGMLYFEKMKALVGSWRRIWGQGEFPFLFVQLAPFKYNNPQALPGIWEAQEASLSIPQTGMAVITDISNILDIHPRNKLEVGRRLALWALAKTYGQEGFEYSGPVYQSMKVDGNKIILSFTHAQGLKALDGKPLTWFTIAGEDKNFVEAKAEIDGEQVVVSAASVEKPVAVRFGWHEIAEPNFANGAGLPASPFRTDK